MVNVAGSVLARLRRRLTGMRPRQRVLLVALLVALVLFGVAFIKPPRGDARGDAPPSQDVILRFERDLELPYETSGIGDEEGPGPQGGLADAVRASPRFRDEFVIVAFTNLGNLKFTVNWLVSLHRVGADIRLPLLICTDTESYSYLGASGLNVVLLDEAMRAEVGWPVEKSKNGQGEVPAGKSAYLSAGYGVIVRVKMAVTAYIVYALRTPMIFSDVDLVLLRRDPKNAFDDMVDTLSSLKTVDMLIQQDAPGDRCTGFFIERPTKLVRRLFKGWDELLHRDVDKTNNRNQGSFNRVCMALDCEGTFLRILDDTAPYGYLPGRLIFFNTTQPVYQSAIDARWPYAPHAEQLSLSPSEYPFMAHANWLVGAEKLDKLKLYNVWWADDLRHIRAAGLKGDPYPDGA